MFPFMNPFLRRNVLPIAPRTDVSMIHMFGATETANEVTLKVKYRTLQTLPHTRGIITLTVENLPAITTDTLPVFVSDGVITKPLLLSDGSQMEASEFANGEHIIFCYDKSSGTIKLTSSEALPEPAAEANTVSTSSVQAKAVSK